MIYWLILSVCMVGPAPRSAIACVPLMPEPYESYQLCVDAGERARRADGPPPFFTIYKCERKR